MKKIDYASIEDLECRNCHKPITDNWMYREGAYLCKDCFVTTSGKDFNADYPYLHQWSYFIEIPIHFMGESLMDSYNEFYDHKLSEDEEQAMIREKEAVLRQKGVTLKGKGKIRFDREPVPPKENPFTCDHQRERLDSFSLGNLTKPTPDKEAIAKYCQDHRELLMFEFVHISSDEYRASTNPGCWKFHSRSAEEGFILYDCGPLDDQLRGYVYHDAQGNITRLDVVGE